MKKIIIANWKMNPQSRIEAESIFNGINNEAKNVKDLDIVICPPFPFLSIYKKLKMKKIKLGAQNLSTEVEGPYTGEVSPKMLSGEGVSCVIVGHSERRKMGEEDNTVNKKLLNSLKGQLIPILCIGENTRNNNIEYLLYVKNQLEKCLSGVSRAQMRNIIIAYEPVWAIGKDAVREATAEEFIEMKIFIKKTISDIYGATIAHSTKIIYGGSVHPQNAGDFVIKGKADGLLIGRDSLSPKKFIAIINAIK